MPVVKVGPTVVAKSMMRCWRPVTAIARVGGPEGGSQRR